jgi:hypothetical protein
MRDDKIKGMRLFFVGLFCGSILAWRPLCACTCETQTTEELRDQANLIFSGTLSNIQVDKKTGETSYVFDIIDLFKGTADLDVTLTDSLAGDDCALELKEKDTYLVYARWVWGAMVTSRCFGTKKIEDANDDAKVIGPGSSWKSDQYPTLKKSCMGHDGAFCCLKSVDTMAKDGYLPENPESGCPSGLVPTRLKCAGSLRWCIPATN